MAQPNPGRDLLIIGGGAAGFFASINAAEAAPGLRVLILEKSSQLLGKVRISGGGRCNVTHACFDPQQLVGYYPRGGKALLSAFTRFQPRDTVEWFRLRGVKLKTEADGRMFPITDSSQTIIDCLMRAARRQKVEIRTKTTVGRLTTDGSRFEAHLTSGEVITVRQVLLATGGDRNSLQLASRLSHSIESPVPSLFTFNIRDERLHDLAGISVPEATVRLPGHKLEARGPLLVTHWGLSGPAVLRLSAWGARSLHENQYRAALVVNWLPGLTREQINHWLQDARESHPRQKAMTSPPDARLPQRLWAKLTRAAGFSDTTNWADASKTMLSHLVDEIHQGEYLIQGKGQFKDEFVTCGGVSLDEINFKTMQSRLVPGLYFAGEILNIDGLTGGFNFQNAWTTAWLAAQSIASQQMENSP